MQANPVYFWILFGLMVTGMLALDLLVFHRKAHEVKLKEALIWSAVWIALSLVFNLIIYFTQGQEKALRFFTGYIIEKALSVDNLFVFLVIFSYFRVPASYQHRVLFWGILSAFIMRAIFIAAGITLIQKFHWTIYVFGIFLIITGIRMAFKKDEEVHPERNVVLKLFKKFMPVTTEYENEKFFVRKAGQLFATPLFVVLLIIETTDLIFAVDSIPAVLAITTDPFIVYSSNIFAILGLRALYFALAGIMQLFHYLHYGLSLILVFVGAKMLISEFYKIPIGWALSVVATILIFSILTSMLFPGKQKPEIV